MADDNTFTPEPVRTSIAPWLAVSWATEAVSYYQAAFGAVECYRLEDESGRVVVARLAIEEAEFWLQEDPDACPEAAGARSVRMLVIVNDPDAMFAQAIAAGATEVFAMCEDHGWRTGRLVDPFGHDWEICKPLE